MGHIHRFQGHLISYTNKPTVLKIPVLSCTESILPIQSSPIWFVHCSNGIHSGSQGRQTDDSKQEYKIPPEPTSLVSYAEPHPTKLVSSIYTQILVALCQELDWVVNMEKSELEPKQIFDFVG